jgi:serine protein kinase
MDSIFRRLGEHQQNHRVSHWEGTFRDYLALVFKHPQLAQVAHTRVSNIVRAFGVDTQEHGDGAYQYLTQELFGIDEAVAKVVEHLKAVGTGSAVSKSILMLYEQPCSGKSQLAIFLKRVLEEFTRTDEGAVYAIADCPQRENPLHLIPHSLRQELLVEFDIYIEGELCPICAINLRQKYDGHMFRVPVRRIFFSDKDRIGNSTFVPSDAKSPDISELVGSIALATVGESGAENEAIGTLAGREGYGAECANDLLKEP